MKALKAVISSILAMLVLISSMGFFVDHMVCGMSGEHKIAINQSVEHCSKDCDRSESESVKKSCCDYDSNYFKDDLKSSSLDSDKKIQFSAFHFIPLATVCTLSLENDDAVSPPTDRAALFPSVRRYLLLETFLI